MRDRQTGAAARAARRSAWIPWVFVGGFGVILAANGALVHYATSTRVGLVSEDAYERGLAYERLIEEADREAALGWRATIVPGRLESGGALVRIELTDREGPVGDAAAVIRMTRPIEADMSAPVEIAIVDGRGEARIAGLRPGQWEVALTVTREGRTVRFSRRVVLS